MDTRTPDWPAAATSELDLAAQRHDALVRIAQQNVLTPVDLELFHVKDAEDFRMTTHGHLRNIGLSREKSAIENALEGVLNPVNTKTLGERRETFQHEYGVSLSTTIRLERLGAEALVRQWSKSDAARKRREEFYAQGGQPRRPSSPAETAARLVEENARLRKELEQKNEALTKIRGILDELGIEPPEYEY